MKFLNKPFFSLVILPIISIIVLAITSLGLSETLGSNFLYLFLFLTFWMIGPLIFYCFSPVVFNKTKEQEKNKKNLLYFISSFIFTLFILFIFLQFNLINNYLFIIFNSLLAIINLWYAVKLKTNPFIKASLISLLALNNMIFLFGPSVNQITFLTFYYLAFLILLFISNNKTSKLEINNDNKDSNKKKNKDTKYFFINPIFGSFGISLVITFVYGFIFLRNADLGLIGPILFALLPFMFYPFLYIIILFIGLLKMYRRLKKSEEMQK